MFLESRADQLACTIPTKTQAAGHPAAHVLIRCTPAMVPVTHGKVEVTVKSTYVKGTALLHEVGQVLVDKERQDADVR